VVLGCIDSRVPLEAIFDQTFGSICVIRSGAHVVDRAVLGSVGFAVLELKVPLIMVLGHERCGAVASTVAALRADRHPPGDLAYLVDEIAPAVLATGLDTPDVEAKAMRVHVGRTVRRLKDVIGVAEAIASGRVSVVGAVYDLDTGWVGLLP
jgi:carbonic anhydrase